MPFRPNSTPAQPTAVDINAIRSQIHAQLLETMDMNEASRMPPAQLQQECTRRVQTLITEQRYPLTKNEQDQLVTEVMDDVFGLGPLEEFLRDPTVSDVLVNGPSSIYLERHGMLEKTSAKFRDSTHLMRVIHRIAANIGRRVDEFSPMLDARLSDGSRVNAIIPPLSLDGPMLSIRRFGTLRLDINEMIIRGTLAEEMAVFLEACVRCRANILVSGGTGAGKTTLLDVFAHWINPNQRVITIEDAAELQLQQQHVIRLETRPPNIEGKGEVTQRDLLRNALRMRPDRIIIGEVRGGETLDMLQAMNTGHEGSMTTVHANNPREAVRRLENMVIMAGFNIPLSAIRQQISAAIDVVVHASRLTGGVRKITHISEVTGMEGDVFSMQDIFKYAPLGVDDAGKVRGCFEAQGIRPRIVERIQAHGIDLPRDLFQHRILVPARGATAEKGGSHA